MRIQTLSILAALFVFGCNSDPDTETGDTDTDTDTDQDTDTDTDSPELEGLDLIGLDFVLDSSEGYEPVVGTDVRIGFDESMSGGLSFSLYADCNTTSGDIVLTDGVVTVGALAMTEIGCAPELATQDTWLADFISDTPTLVHSEDTLTLTGTDATLVFLNEDVVTPDEPLAGPLWTIDTYIEGQAATNLNLAQPATILFKQDGSLVAFTGCNDGGGSFKNDHSKISFNGVYYTRMACADVDVARAEGVMTQVIANGTSGYVIDGKRITIELGDFGISGTTP